MNKKPMKNWKAVYRSWGKELKNANRTSIQQTNMDFLLEDMYEKMHKENNYGIDAKFL